MMIFVFGSNLAGVHGAGAAVYAHKFKGAQWGKGNGLYGESYAIPTKDKDIQTLPLSRIKQYVDHFIYHALSWPELEFQVTRIGCGLAGLKDEDIAPMFKDAPNNCLFDEAWKPWLPGKKFWGTY